MVDIRQDTETVKREFEGISTPTQVFIWSLVAMGVLLGVLLGGALGYGVAVEEVEGRECIEHDATLYCADEGDQPPPQDGGRGTYFEDPNGDPPEIITRPYGGGS